MCNIKEDFQVEGYRREHRVEGMKVKPASTKVMSNNATMKLGVLI